MCLPSIVQGKHDSSHSHTYTHSTGSVDRIDYVSVPMSVLAYLRYTCTHDLGLIKLIDHFAAQCSVCIPTKSVCSVRKMVNGKRNYGYDHTAFCDPVESEKFKCAISFCDHNAPYGNSSSRNHYISIFAYNSLCEFSPLGEHSPVEPRVPPDTLDIIKESRSIRSQINYANFTGAHLSVVYRFVKFKAASRAARISLRNDYRENSIACMEAQRASEEADLREFFQIKQSLSPRSSYSSTYMHGLDDVCVYYEDIGSAFQKYFSGLLDGEVMIFEEATADLDACQFLFAKASIPPPSGAVVKVFRPLAAAGPHGLKLVVPSCRVLIHI